MEPTTTLFLDQLARQSFPIVLLGIACYVMYKWIKGYKEQQDARITKMEANCDKLDERARMAEQARANAEREANTQLASLHEQTITQLNKNVTILERTTEVLEENSAILKQVASWFKPNAARNA